MAQEDKDLLFKDLSARLPYHVKVKVWLEDGDTEEGVLDLEYNYADVLQDAFYYNKIKDIKPYLRPMSSMTEEEIQEAENNGCIIYWNVTLKGTGCSVKASPEGFDYLNSIHVDYRGLISKGLALEAPEGMYNLIIIK